MQRRRFFLLLSTAVLAALAPLRAQEPGLPAAAVERLEGLISREMSRQEVPGLSAAVVTAHRLRWSAGFGFADLENHVPAKAATMYRLASISKPITAVAVLQLAESGKLDLDAPVQRYVPSFPAKAWPVTCRQLLGHLGGVRHYRGDEIASTRPYAGVADSLAIFQHDPLLHEPGTKYAYTTYGYNLLGAAAEAAAATPYAALVRERIFVPAGMTRIRPDAAMSLIPNRAQGYRRLPGGELANSILADVSNKLPGGGFCGTAEDLARFAIAVHTGRLLKPETRAMMITPQKTRDGQETGYGLGWSIARKDGRLEVSHGGAQPRVATLLYTLPDEQCAVALMCNLEGTRLAELARAMAAAALEGR